MAMPLSLGRLVLISRANWAARPSMAAYSAEPFWGSCAAEPRALLLVVSCVLGGAFLGGLSK